MTARTPDGPGDPGPMDRLGFERVEVREGLGESSWYIAIADKGERVLICGSEAMAERARALLGSAPTISDDVHRVGYLLVELSAEDRAMVRQLAERLAAR